MTEDYDFIVIGGGSAGYAAARTAREVCERVAIVDSATELGGLCILRGCMPSKTVIYSAEVLHLAQRGKLFGLNIPSVEANMKAVYERKQAMVADFKSYRQEQLNSNRFTLLRDKAVFVDENTIELQSSGKRLTARRFLIATGSVVQIPPVRGLADVPFWSSDDVLDLDFLPESVIVLGGGIVACELAQYLRRMGSKVIQIQRSPRILKEVSEDASEVAEKVFRAEGIELYTDTQLEQVAHKESCFEVSFRHKGELMTVSADHLFNALGRRASTDGLGLEKAGVTLRDNGQIRVDSYQRSSNHHIYAAGDVSGPYEIVHIAVLQGEIAARHATGRETEPVDYASRTGVIFTDPQIATVGLPLEEAGTQCIDCVAASYPFDDHGKSILMEARQGYVKVWADKADGRIIGAECVGKDAGELIHPMAVAVSLRAKAADLLKVHWYHPTLSEIWTYPLEEIVEK